MKKKEMPKPHEVGIASIRHPRPSDMAEFVGRAADSAGFHSDLVSPPDDEAAFHVYLSRSQSETDKCFLILESSSGSIAGAINISQIFLKGFCSAYLGYYLFDGFTGRGLMTAGMEEVLLLSFTGLGLHRLEANIQPANGPSIRLVERCGFKKEGFSRKYLQIAGDWRDHERWALIKEDWEERISK